MIWLSLIWVAVVSVIIVSVFRLTNRHKREVESIETAMRQEVLKIICKHLKTKPTLLGTVKPVVSGEYIVCNTCNLAQISIPLGSSHLNAMRIAGISALWYHHLKAHRSPLNFYGASPQWWSDADVD